MRATREKEREKIIKILNIGATVTVHICMVTVTIVHLCTILHPLIWVFFGQNVQNKGFFVFRKTLHPLMWMLLQWLQQG